MGNRQCVSGDCVHGNAMTDLVLRVDEHHSLFVDRNHKNSRKLWLSGLL